MQMDHALRVGPGGVHGCVQCETGHVNGGMRGRIGPDADELAAAIDLDQVGCGDLVEREAKSVDQEVIGLSRHGRRQMGVDQIVPTVERGQSVRGGKVDPHSALGLADLAAGHNGIGAQGKRHEAPPMEEAF